MSLEYIQKHYGVPAKKGERVVIFSGQRGTIVGAKDARLMIHIDGEKLAKPYHPTWHIDYFTNCPWLKEDEIQSKDAADEEKLCKICGQGPEADHNNCMIIAMHR